MTGTTNNLLPEIKEGLEKVRDVYGLSHAKRLEQLYRNETAHFNSSNFRVTFSPGMEVAPTKVAYPYGWTSLVQFWDMFPAYKPETTFTQMENTSALLKSRGKRTFICFPTIEAGMMTVAYLIKIRGGNFGSWFSKNAVAQKKYNEILDTIKVRLV